MKGTSSPSNRLLGAKRTGNAGPGHGSEGSKMTIEEELESGDLGTGNGKMLVDGLWFSINFVEVNHCEKLLGRKSQIDGVGLSMKILQSIYS